MESGLLDMDHGVVDSEEINAIFRAAHSIKGGSGTFGFNKVSDFTHVVETLLDEMRDGAREVTPEAVAALLESVDVIRSLLVAARDGTEVDAILVKAKYDDLQEMLGVSSNEQLKPVVIPQVSSPDPSDTSTSGWHIVFRPLDHLCRTGNDPLGIIRELSGLGELQVDADISAIPELSRMEPETCYISWDMRLKGEVPRAEVDEVFDWVEDDCDLVVMPILSGEDLPQPEPIVAEVEVMVEQPLVERRQSGRRKQNRRSPIDRRSVDRRSGASMTGSSSIRVDIEKVDSLINMVGELVITQSMLS